MEDAGAEEGRETRVGKLSAVSQATDGEGEVATVGLERCKHRRDRSVCFDIMGEVGVTVSGLTDQTRGEGVCREPIWMC